MTNTRQTANPKTPKKVPGMGKSATDTSKTGPTGKKKPPTDKTRAPKRGRPVSESERGESELVFEVTTELNAPKNDSTNVRFFRQFKMLL